MVYWKTCTVCLKKKSEHYFYPNETGADGLCSICKLCSREYDRYKREKAKANKKPLDKIQIHPYVRPVLTTSDPRILIDRNDVTVRFD